MRKAVYPGTFDPVTNGHLDLIERGSRLFSEIIVLVARNPGKDTLFTTDERVALIETEVRPFPNVRVDSADGLTVHYVRQAGFDTILRGIRTTMDFVSEYSMAMTNRSLAPEIDTVFLMPDEKWSYLSSSLIREVVLSGGQVDRFVPESVNAALGRKLAR
jgi:pantetheine-phosphate adenylyltransferase